MTLKMYHQGTGGRNGLDFCCGCLHGAEGPRILEVVAGRETLTGIRYEMLGRTAVCLCVWQLHVDLESTDICVSSLLETCLTYVPSQHRRETCTSYSHPSLPDSQNSVEESL